MRQALSMVLIVIAALVCTENLNPGVMVMKSTEDRG